MPFTQKLAPAALMERQPPAGIMDRGPLGHASRLEAGDRLCRQDAGAHLSTDAGALMEHDYNLLRPFIYGCRASGTFTLPSGC
jgi:hypothetical protein